MKELEKYLNELGEIGSAALEATKEQIDLEATSVYEELKRNTPSNTGELASSLKLKKVDTEKTYGYGLEYEGEHSSGVNNEKLASILNYGNSRIPGKHFKDRAVRKLKGIDGRIYLRWQNKIDKR